jgi:ribose/xylose/arabinose/galactoside ABC-type transport system permease subunit
MISRQIRAVFSNQAFSMLVILIAMWSVLSQLSPYFFTVGNISEITLQTAVIGIIAAGETLIIISGGIDLSVGSIFACSGVLGGLVLQKSANLPAALLTTILFGTSKRPFYNAAARATLYRDSRNARYRTRIRFDPVERHTDLWP